MDDAGCGNYTVFLTVAIADEHAEQCQDREEDGWHYFVDPDPKGSGRSIIRVYDEHGQFLGNL